MTLTAIDWAVIVLYFVVSIAIALFYSRRAGASSEEYFLSGRAVPWWLAGTSMVATTFAADTPLVVTGLTVKYGIAGNWLWWSMVMSGILTVVFYAKLWRRAGVMTDAEFAEIRYSGRPAAFLRGFRACYLALAINSIIIGWVTAAMAKIIGMTLNVGKVEATVGLFVLTGLYSTISGLWGVVVTDFFQFILAMSGCIALAFFALGAVGGMSGLLATLHTRFPDDAPLAFVPSLDSAWMPALTFFVYLAVNWWASWYPGAEPGGGGYVAQRILSTKNERHALLAALWFNIAHYALRPWPWIVVALVSMVLYPGLADPESGYVKVMVDHLPPFWRGFLIAAFFAAYMSTISTQLNWGASYLVNDVYRRFWARGRSERHYAGAGRLATVVMMVISGVVTMNIGTVEGAWKFLLAIGAGTGLVYLLRWYWWRVNAWSEVSAMAAALIFSLAAQLGLGLSADDPRGFAQLLLLTTAATTVVWLAVTYLTAPEPAASLRTFYWRVRPGGPGWTAIVPTAGVDVALGVGLVQWALGCAVVYLGLFGIGGLVLGRPVRGAIAVLAALALTWYLVGATRGVPEPKSGVV
ncbi:MAG TPA: sodium:solute symporter family protein [Methylomirabilota bacterium]|jgi:Na+/proline symporter|nr:sodium:solute symporter family protein [Methylomirabilota bacterium]